MHLFLPLAHVRDGPFVVKNQIYTRALRAFRHARARVGKGKKRNRGNTKLGQTKVHTIHGESSARLDGFEGNNSYFSWIWFSVSCCTCWCNLLVVWYCSDKSNQKLWYPQRCHGRGGNDTGVVATKMKQQSRMSECDRE